jgi:hypothetical protein
VEAHLVVVVVEAVEAVVPLVEEDMARQLYPLH